MLISSQKLIGLKVETQSGTYIGRVQSFEVEVDTQGIVAYSIKPSLLEGGPFSEELRVHQGQVVSISDEKMVIMDNVVKYKEKEEKKVFIGAQADT
jgi:sporulation protein YlmC with PRC-barrel domain